MYIKELTNSEFREFTKEYNMKAIYQTPEYGFTMNQEKFDSLFLGLIDNENIIAASLILIENKEKFKYAYAPRGFLIDYNNYELLKQFTNEIKKYLGKLGIIAVKLCPLIIKNIYDSKHKLTNTNIYYENMYDNLKKLGYNHLGYNNYFEGLKPRYEAILDLDLPYYILFKNIKKEFRTKIRGAEKLGIKIHKGNFNDLEYLYLQTQKKYPRELDYFKNCYKFFNKEKNIEFYYAKLDTVKFLRLASKNLSDQEEVCKKSNLLIINDPNSLNQKMQNDLILNKCKTNLIYATKLVQKYPDGLVVASALIGKNNDEVYCLMDGYNTSFKRLNAKHLLIWKLIEKYSNEGYKKFNLGGLTNPEIENNLYHGLNEFKTSFNSKIIEYIGDLELITNKSLYFMYKNKISIKNILKK